ncbi:MAG: hypothetical protein ACRENP_18835 [Longimicrobiales bacterium]
MFAKLFLLGVCLGSVSQVQAQGIGRPPLFDAVPGGTRLTVQLEGAVNFDENAPWSGSTGVRVRRDWRHVGVASGAGLLAAREPGYVLSLSGQYNPEPYVLIDGAERALWLSGGPIVDLVRAANEPLGRQYSIAAALGVVAMLGLPGFNLELAAAPRYEVRFVATDDRSERDATWGVQTGVVVGVAQFVQLLFQLDWSSQGVRAVGPLDADGTWTFGLGLRTRLPTG